MITEAGGLLNGLLWVNGYNRIGMLHRRCRFERLRLFYCRLPTGTLRLSDWDVTSAVPI